MKLWEETLLFILMFSGDVFRAFVIFIMGKLEFMFKRLFRSRGCIGYPTTPPENTLMEGESRGQTVKEDRRSEDLSASCTFEMDQSAAQPQENMSSVGTSNQPSTSQTSADPRSDTPAFVNHGLLLWNQTREQWLQGRRSESRPQDREARIGEYETYESLLGTNEPFPEPIPLAEMVDFLVDDWDMEGLYD